MINKLSIGLLCCLVTLPFLFPYHNYPLITFHAEWFTIVLALVFSGLVLLADKERAMPLLVVPVIVLALYTLGRGLFLPYWQPSGQACAYLLTAALVIWATFCLYRQVDDLPYIVLVALAVGAFVMVLAGLSQYFHIMTVAGGIRGDEGVNGMGGTLGQRSLFAAYVACGMAAVLSLRCHWGIVLLLGLVMAFAEAFSGSRAVWVFMLLLLPLALAGKRVPLWAVLFATFAVVRFTVAADAAPRPGAGTFWGTFVINPEEAIVSRWDYMTIAFRIWVHNPILGTGFGEYAYNAFLLARTDDPQIERHCHNIILQLAAELGLVGVVLFLGIVFCWCANLCGSIFQARTRFSVNYGMLTVLGILVVFSFTEFPMWHAQFLMLACVAMVLGVFFTGTLRVSTWIKYIAIACVGLGLIAAGTVYRDYQRFEGFLVGNIPDITFKSTMRNHLESMALITGMVPKEPEYYPLSKVLVEKALHTFPRPELVCEYRNILDGLKEDSSEVTKRIIALGFNCSLN